MKNDIFSQKIPEYIMKSKLDFFYFMLYFNQQENKKKMIHPKNYPNSKFTSPLQLEDNKLNNGIGLLMGQMIKNKYLICFDIDNKEKMVNDIFYSNGCKKWKELLKQYNYKTKTPIQRTPSGGLHYYYVVDEDFFNILPKSITGMHIDENFYSFDMKIQDQYMIVEPSYYIIDGEKYEYKFLYSDFEKIEEPPQFLLDIIKNNINQTKAKNNIIKKIIEKEKNINVKNKIINQASQEEITIIREILDLLPTKIKTETSSWLQVGKALYNLGVPLEIYDEWSKCDTYEKEQCKKRYYYFSKMNLSHGLHTLLFYLKSSANKDKVNSIYDKIDNIPRWKKERDDYFFNLWALEKIYDNGIKYEPIIINTKYLLDKNAKFKKFKNPQTDTEIVSNMLHNFVNDEIIKFLIISSYYGSGKTTMIKLLLSLPQFQRILFVSYRKSLSYDIERQLKNFNFKNYLDDDRENLYTCDRLIIQYESLHKIINDGRNIGENIYLNYYDLIILDEMESLLYQCDSITNKEKNKINYNLFRYYCKISTKVLCLDGDISNKSLFFVNSFNLNGIP
jgi:hypothetical protein